MDDKRNKACIAMYDAMCLRLNDPVSVLYDALTDSLRYRLSTRSN